MGTVASQLRDTDSVIEIQSNIQITLLQEKPNLMFLSNPGNKQNFLDILADAISSTPRLSATKCQDDADRTIVTSVSSASKITG